MVDSGHSTGVAALDKAGKSGAGRKLPGEWFSADLEPWMAKGYSSAS